MGKSILEILGVLDREDTITNMLEYGIINNPGFANRVMSLLTDKEENSSFSDVSARTRMKVKGGVPDLVISGVGPEGPEIVVVENKIKAGEGKDQTERYFLGKNEIKEKISGMNKHINFRNPVRFVFLTLNPYDQPADQKNYKHINYSDLLNAVEPNQLGDNPLLSHLWTEFTGAVRDYYKALQVSDEDLILDHWIKTDEDPLEKSFLHFATSFLTMDLGSDLVASAVFKSKAWGTPVYQVIICKENWKVPRELPAKEDYSQGLGYYIHFEPTLKEDGRGGALLDLYLHYEHRRYRSDSEEKKLGEQNRMLLEEYEEKRERFKSAMEAIKVNGFKLKGGRNQIGVANFSLEKEMTLSNFRARLKKLVLPLAEGIDQCLVTIS